MIEKFFSFLEWARHNPFLLQFSHRDLLLWILISLGLGLLAVLIELRLPLKYYWQLPLHALKALAEGFHLRSPTPVWGYCLEKQSKKIIPVAAIELLDAERKEVVQTTYSNRLGQYGFRAPAGKYFLRAVKNEYQAPSFLDPENIRLIEIKESFTHPIKVGTGEETIPHLNLELEPRQTFDPHNPKSVFLHYLKNFFFILANGFLALAIVLSFLSWAITQEIVFGLFLASALTLLFIKIYILETITRVTNLN